MAALERAKGWLCDIFAHHHAEGLRTARAVARMKYGVQMEDYPYPGASITTTTTNFAPPPPGVTPPLPNVPTVTAATVLPVAAPMAIPASSSWKQALALLTALGVGAGGLATVNKLTAPVAPVAPVVAPAPVGQQWQIKVNVDESGKLKLTPVPPK